jgi:hypothetical protein
VSTFAPEFVWGPDGSRAASGSPKLALTLSENHCEASALNRAVAEERVVWEAKRRPGCCAQRGGHFLSSPKQWRSATDDCGYSNSNHKKKYGSLTNRSLCASWGGGGGRPVEARAADPRRRALSIRLTLEDTKKRGGWARLQRAHDTCQLHYIKSQKSIIGIQPDRLARRASRP